MKQSNVFPFALLVGGAIAATFFGAHIVGELLFDGSPSFGVLMSFAIACVAGALGFVELKATEDFNETFYGE